MGRVSSPTSPMSWYSGSHEMATSCGGVELGRPRRWRRGSTPSTRSGSMTPLGSDVEPLVYCRITSRSGSGSGDSMRVGAGAAAAGQHVVEQGAWAGRPALPRRTRPAASSISRSLASPWRMRSRVPLTNSSSEPMRMGSGSTIAGRARQPAALDGGDQAPAGGRRGWPRGRRARCPGACSAAPTPRPPRGAGPTETQVCSSWCTKVTRHRSTRGVPDAGRDRDGGTVAGPSRLDHGDAVVAGSGGSDRTAPSDGGRGR